MPNLKFISIGAVLVAVLCIVSGLLTDDLQLTVSLGFASLVLAVLGTQE